MGRIVSTNPCRGSGSYGQSVPPIRRDAGSWHQRILIGRENAGARFNVSCLNLDRSEKEITLDLYDVDGVHLGVRTMVLPPWGTEQINRIFDAYRPIAGYVEA